MNITWISLAFAIIVGLTKLLTYILGDKRKIRALQKREYELKDELRKALAAGDTARISFIERELGRVRAQLADLIGK